VLVSLINSRVSLIDSEQSSVLNHSTVSYINNISYNLTIQVSNAVLYRGDQDENKSTHATSSSLRFLTNTLGIQRNWNVIH
jgi:hypothetical protein